MPKANDSTAREDSGQGTTLNKPLRDVWLGIVGNRMSKFSKRARLVFELAQEEARGLHHNYIGTEHVLLGLLREGEGVGAKALLGLGMELDQARGAVEDVVGRGEGDVRGDLATTPRTKKVLELALDEARRLGHLYVGTEHLLLGLVREGDGVAAGIIEGFGVGLQQARDAVMAILVASPGLTADSGGAKDNVLTCRIDAADLKAIDLLVESGIRATRSETAAWLIHAGIDAHSALFAKLHQTVAEIRRLRTEAQSIAQGLQPSSPQPTSGEHDTTSAPPTS